MVVLLGGFLWVQHEASPGGRPGTQVIATVRSGTGANQLASTLEAKGVIGSSLAYRIWSQFHSSPSVLPGSYAFRKNSSFATVDQVIGAGPNVFPLEIPPGFTVAEVATRVGQLPGHTEAAFAAVATGGTVQSPWQPVGLDQPRRAAGHRAVHGGAGGDRHPAADRHGRPVRPPGRRPRPPGRSRPSSGSPRTRLITVASIVEKEGVIQKNLGPVARVILNRLANDMPLQMDSTVLYSEGRDGGPVTSADLAIQLPVQHLPEQGPDPDPDLLPVPGRPPGRPRPPGRIVAVLRGGGEGRHRGLRRHLRPTAGQRGAGPAAGRWDDGGHHGGPAPRRRGPVGLSAATTVVGVIGDPVAHSLSPLLHNTAFAELGLDWVSVGFPVPAGRTGGGPGRGPGPGHPGPVGDHAPQGRGGPSGCPALAPGRAAGCRQLRGRHR